MIKVIKKLLFLVLYMPIILAMETSVNSFDLSSAIKSEIGSLAPFCDKSIDSIPKYLYENPYQYKKYNWSQDILDFLKEDSQTLTLEKIKEALSHKELTQENLKGFIESLDWVYCLSQVEAKYLKKDITTLSIGDLIEINKCISRFIKEGIGEGLRKIHMIWGLKAKYTLAEDLFYDYLNDKNNKRYNIDHVFTAKELVEILLSRCDLTQEGLNKIIRDNQGRILDFNEPKKWAEEQNRDNAIHLKTYFNGRYILFCDPKYIEIKLEQLLNYIKSSAGKINPVELAITVWYEIIHIHPFNQAHKRTAKAVASIILLQNGYLPPLITEVDQKAYMAALLTDFKNDKGPNEFAKFMVRAINKTQEDFSRKILE